MANTFTVTYQITLNTTNKDHANYETVNAYIRRTSPATLNTLGVSVSSAKINMSGTTFWSSAGNNPYLDFNNYGRAYVSTSVTDKTSISLTTPSGFSLANLLSVGTSDTAIGIYAYKSTSGNVCTYSSINAVLTITATCYYFATVPMGMRAEDFWLMPIGLFFDLWCCHKQFLGLEKPKRNLSIDDLIPPGI